MMPKAEQIYRHYKGGIYRVICMAVLERDVSDIVIYQRVGSETGPWARPLAEFMDKFTLVTG